MEHIAPFLQTLLWVGLIAGIVTRFHKPIYGLLTALQQRVESGSTIKAGSFELSDQLTTQNPAQQKQKSEAEVREILQIEQEQIPGVASTPPAQVKSRFFVAEDLALRAIQVEFQKPMKRQVAAGPEFAFDAVFTYEHQLHIVEVKYVIREKNADATVRRTLESFASFLNRTNWQNIRIIIAVVFEYAPDLAVATQHLEEMAAGLSLSVSFRCYSLSELRQQFGASDDGDG